MKKPASRYLSVVLAGAILCAAQSSAVAAPSGQATELEILSARQAVAETLVAHGLTTEDVDSRLAQLSDEDVIYFASNLDLIQAGGEEIPEYMWWLGAGLLGVLILAVLL